MWANLPYIRCFYWVINKAALAYGKAGWSQVGNPNRDKGKEG